MKTDRGSYLISAITGTAVSVIFWIFSFCIPDSAVGIHRLGNIKAYIILSALWLGIFYVCSFLLPKVIKKDISPRAVTALSAAAICAVLFALIMLFMFAGFGPVVYSAGAVIFMIALPVICGKCGENKLKKQKDIILRAEIICISCIWFAASSTVNTFSYFSFGRAYNIYHSSAYLDSIMNTYYGAPFTGIESELYGHYSLILVPLLKVIGMNTRSVGIILGILSAASFIFLSSSLMMTVRSFAAKLFGIGALGLFGITAYSIYWQSFPHRLIFPAAAIFILTLGAVKNSFSVKRFLAGLILPSAALIWNTESGAVVAVVWALYGAEAFYRRNKNNKLVYFLISLAISAASSLAIALSVINIYNLCKGGSAVGPVGLMGFGAQGFVDLISKDPQPWNSLHAHIFALLFICGLRALHKLYVKKDKDPQAVFALSVAATGLGMGTYFVNNPEGGSGILSPYFMLAATLILSDAKISNDPYDIVKTALASYAALALFFGGINGMVLIPQIRYHYTAGAYDYRDFSELADKVDRRIAPDTVGGGFGTTALFMEMGRDRIGRDFHFNPDELDSPGHIIKLSDGDDDIEGYMLIDEITYDDIVICYYGRID